MRRCLLVAPLALTALLLPSSASARVPCANETLAATVQTLPQVTEAIDCLVDQQRARFNLPALRRDARLDASARLHSEDMARNDYFSHTDLLGGSPDTRAIAQGYLRGAGENIAFGYPTAVEVMTGWMRSTGHCENLLSNARDIGIGVAISPDGSAYMTQALGDYSGATNTVDSTCPHAELGTPVEIAPVVLPPVSVPPSSAPVATAPSSTARSNAPRALRVSLRRRGSVWTLFGRVSGLSARTAVRVTMAGRTMRTTVRDGRFSLRVRAPRAKTLKVTLIAPGGRVSATVKRP